MDLRKKADELRVKTFEIITDAGGGHYGGSLSVIEIMTVLYYNVMKCGKDMKDDPSRDRFVLCKGHAGPPLYAILADKGYIDPGCLKELDQNGGSLPKHVDRKKVQGIEYSSGPLGQGLSVACGMAVSLKKDYKDSCVYALLGDGECDEGQVWEAAMLAAQYQLDNLMGLEPFTDKWRAFSWDVLEVDGHDVDALTDVFARAKKAAGKPCVIIAHTKKGRGISYMEDNYLWHSGKITSEQFEQGLRDLGVEK